MPYAPTHKAATRSRILTAARQVFALKGFDATSINDVMQASGMTRGAFYAHFESKAALYREVMDATSEAETSVDLLTRLERILTQDAGAGPLPPVKDMLSHVPEVREVVEAAFIHLVQQCVRKVRAGAGREEALAMVSMAVGAAVLGRSVDDRFLRSEMREACLSMAMRFLKPPAPEHDDLSLLWAPDPDACRGRRSQRST
jgi:TetR/AcrR family transcriptional repressor of nem operon